MTYANARYYPAKTGRWLSIDPVYLSLEFNLSDPQSLNSYSYVGNNPLIYVDPNGESKSLFYGFNSLANRSEHLRSIITAQLEGYAQGVKEFFSYTPVDDVLIAATGESITGEEVNGFWRGAAILGLGTPGVDDVARKGLSNLTDLEKVWTNRDKFNDVVTSALEHWKSHQSEFSELNNSVEYVKAAHNFVNNAPEGTLHRSLENGRDALYHQDSNTLVITQQGVPATMFKPDQGIDCFNKLK